MISRNLISTETVKSDVVRSADGERVGKIEELMIDIGRGEVAYAVLSFGGFLGLGDKYFAVPWQSLELDQKDEVFILDVDKEKLEKSPGFDKENWPDFADTSFLHTVNQHYSGVGNYTYRSQ